MQRFAAAAFTCLLATGAHAQDGAKGAASPRVPAKPPAMSTSPTAANSVKDKKRSTPPAAKKPPAADGGMNFSEQQRRMQKQMEAQARSDAAVSKAMKESHDTSKAITPNIK